MYEQGFKGHKIHAGGCYNGEPRLEGWHSLCNLTFDVSVYYHVTVEVVSTL